MVLPADFFWKYFPGLTRDKVVFQNRWCLGWFTVGWCWIMVWCHPPEYTMLPNNPGPWFKFCCTQKWKRGELTDKQYEHLIVGDMRGAYHTPKAATNRSYVVPGWVFE
ncbi:unnamed protein product [Vitrella brassicaformis CCMP3155]|uniref:Uncharacterized protein n=2 Tax=Vitrella brassicaformis TaxID=1169539 RepID=A0A0G4EBT7_VITBC|nr:unnamed protein product [Vitrella brassicaformis CCMP3155]|eukprot:CEL92758.1 unnamed protein product [Vitrella brassicaformis CCMP3155]